MKKEFDLKIDGATLENIKVDSLNSLIIATYSRDAEEFKAGDILIDAYDEDGALEHLSIFKEKSKIHDDKFSVFIAFEIYHDRLRFEIEYWDGIKNNRLATDEEKQLLFDALKKEGLKWNAEKLKIEKIAPKFPTKLEEIDRTWYIGILGDICKWAGFMGAQTPNHLTSKESAEQALEFIKLLAFRDAIWAIEGKPENENIEIAIRFKTPEGLAQFYKMRREIELGNL